MWSKILKQDYINVTLGHVYHYAFNGLFCYFNRECGC
jgi:hypothetical protein